MRIGGLTFTGWKAGWFENYQRMLNENPVAPENMEAFGREMMERTVTVSGIDPQPAPPITFEKWQEPAPPAPVPPATLDIELEEILSWARRV